MSWCVHVRVVRKANNETKITLDGYSNALKSVCERGLGINEDYCQSSFADMPDYAKELFFGKQTDEDGESYAVASWYFYTQASLETAQRNLWGKLKELVLREGRAVDFTKTEKWLLLKDKEKAPVRDELHDVREELGDMLDAYEAITSLLGIYEIYDDIGDRHTWIGVSCE